MKAARGELDKQLTTITGERDTLNARLGASVLMQIETSFHLFGYPGLAILCFLAAAAGGFVIGAPKGYAFSIRRAGQPGPADGWLRALSNLLPHFRGQQRRAGLERTGPGHGIVSWTKSDAQNVSLAIPAREVTHLKADNAVSLWEQPIFAPRLATVPSGTNSPTAEAAVSAERKSVSTSDFSDLSRRLSQSAGKKVTVLVQEDGQESKFDFTVPRGLK